MMDGPDIHDYGDPVVFLADYFRAKLARRPQQSVRGLLLKAGVKSPDLIFKILRGERTLRPVLAAELGVLLGFAPATASCFELLTVLKNSRSELEAKAVREALENLRRERPTHEPLLSGERQLYIVGESRVLSPSGEELSRFPQLREITFSRELGKMRERIWRVTKDRVTEMRNEISIVDERDFRICSNRFFLPGRVVPELSGADWRAYSFFVSYKDEDGAESLRLRGRDSFGADKFQSFESFEGVTQRSFVQIVEGRYVSKSELEDVIAAGERAVR